MAKELGWDAATMKKELEALEVGVFLFYSCAVLGSVRVCALALTLYTSRTGGALDDGGK